MKFAPFLVLGVLGASGYLSGSLKSQTEAPETAEGLEAHHKAAGASVLGQFRTSITGWLWVRTDLYLHNGVEMRMLTESEKRQGKRGVGSSDEELGALLNDDALVTLVPGKERDFRGIFGDIERETQTYQRMEGHAHNEPEDSIPLFRLMTWIEPKFIPGWTTAATITAGKRTEESFDKAIAILREGLEANPNHVGLLNELGRFYAGKKKDFGSAIPVLQRAVDQDLDVANLDVDTAESYLNAHRWLALCYRETGAPGNQQQVAALGLKRFPQDPVLSRLLGEPPFVLSEQGQREWLERSITDHSKPEGHEHSGTCGHDHDHDH